MRDSVDAMPPGTKRSLTEYERAKFVVRLFYHLGARITEITRHRMENFVRVTDRSQWSVVGKGGIFRGSASIIICVKVT